LILHDRSVTAFGGSHGLRDAGLLESAVARPFQIFGGADLYPSVFSKASAITESIIVNHPFIDGNKRTGLLVMIALLSLSNLELTAQGPDLYELIIKISTGEIKFDEIAEWLKKNTTPVVRENKRAGV
jgi:death on curing protein